ncbi:protein kinase [Actinoplanes sp. NPDC048988]|uniref:serine/threonine-protein kinase n=1 Tax=Actinoplanes sp. NPDC048988 TaxID=3363901 RepID=UPI0037243F00
MPLITGRYRLDESLGQGGMGRVWRARDEVLQRDVAIKELLQEGDAEHRRLLREARAAARLGHPNVVQVFDVLEVDGHAWIVMEYVPSRSLQEAMRDEGPLDPRRVARIGLELLSALRAAHKAGVAHRDVKPANVLLADDGRVLLTDFGIATIEGDAAVSTSDVLIGSPEYMSPERARTGVAGLASDLWSLGATLYAAVEGQSPFHRTSAIATLTALAADEPDPPRRAGPLEPLLTGLLRKDPAERIGATEAEHLLRAAASGSYGHASVVRRDDSPDGTIPATGSPAESDAPASPPKLPLPAPSTPAERLSNAEPAPSTPTSPAPDDEPPDDEPPGDVRPGDSPLGAEVLERGPGAARGSRRTRIGLAAAVAVLLLAGVVWMVVRAGADSTGDGTTAEAPPVAATTPATGGPASAGPTGSASAPASPTAASPSAVASRTSAAPPTSAPAAPGSGSGLPALPDGWRDYRDPTGFAVYVPEGWTRSQEKTMVYFRDSSTGRVLGIDQTRKPEPDPVADWRGKADYRVSAGDFPSYREIHIREVDYFRKAADWEFTFTRKGVRQHVNNRGVITATTQAYGFYWQTRDADWQRYRGDLQLVFDSFRPARR